MAKYPMNERHEKIGKHQRYAETLKRWISDYSATIDEADTLARWCEGAPPSVPMEAVDHAIRFADRDLAGLLKNLDQFIVETKAES